MADAGHEPSMEEILSSIKRIIAEDSQAGLSIPRGKRSVTLAPETDVLELTEPAPAPQPSAPEPSKDTPVATPEPATLVSPRAADASRTSLAALSKLVVKPEVAGSDTLEGMVRDMLKPLLAEWLDANLPAVVERLVSQEIARIADRG